jgi:hypothetical protein
MFYGSPLFALGDQGETVVVAFYELWGHICPVLFLNDAMPSVYYAFLLHGHFNADRTRHPGSPGLKPA